MANKQEFDPDKSNTMSKVSERLQWLEGSKVTIRLAYAEIGNLGGETFDAIYEDTVPLGRAYFFVFNISGRRRLVQTTSVIAIDQY